MAFKTDTFNYKPNHIAWINASFKTQKDSVFFDSEHDLRDRFFIKIDSSQKNNLLKQMVSKAAEGDSLCILIPTNTFFTQQFNSKVPFFCNKDSIIKIYLRVKEVFTDQEYLSVINKISKNETEEIERFFTSPKDFEFSRDSLGFYWVEKPINNNLPKVKYGDLITISYQGSFLNGRIVDTSPQTFQVKYGTPDQLLKGLNYVISKLKIGQNSKIILPSHLAFGENGASNGSIPPYTPMLYKISILDIKN